MRPAALVDTGFLLAVFERRDQWHRACLRTLEAVHYPLLTSEAVLAEMFHLVGGHPRDVEAAWKFVRSEAIALASITAADLPALEYLMAHYHDRPMDFADATLVRLAERESLSTILTIDHDDFETYRIGGRKRFTILPGRGDKD